MKSGILLRFIIVVVMLSFSARSSVMAQVITGPNVNVSDMSGYQGEVGIAVNPTNPLNAVVVTNELVDLTKLGVWHTFDGGATWIANFVVLPWFGYHPSIVEAFELTAIFTAISVIRVFLWRRAFNWYQERKT